MSVQVKKQGLLSIIVPVYNEQATVEEMVEKITAVDLEPLGLHKEIIIVDDGSTDTTREILKKIHKTIGNTNIVRIFFNRLNLGKGTAIRVGLMYARGEIILIQDADLEYDPIDYPQLLQPIVEGSAQVVLGSRFLDRHWYPRYPLSHRLGIWFLTVLANILYGAKITDEATCFKVATADVFRSLGLKCREFEFCPEFIAKVRKKNIRIVEVPVHFYPRTREEGKKIGWYDGWQAIKTLLRYRIKD